MRLIDADKLIEKAYYRGKLPDPGDLYPDGKEVVDVEDIDDAPTVDAVEVVHGRWVDRYNGMFTKPLYECSECKESALYDSLWKQHLTNYCPNCGAHMDLEETE